jgi:integrase
MPRRTQDSVIDTRTARAKLAARGLPYWRDIGERGIALGYRRLKGGAGTWSYRILIKGGETSKYATKIIGTADDVSVADGVRVLDYQMAVAAVRTAATISAMTGKGGEEIPKIPVDAITVATAIDLYLKALKHRGQDNKDASYKLAAHVTPVFGERKLASIAKIEIEEWLYNLAMGAARVRSAKGTVAYGPPPKGEEEIRRRKNSANRVLKILKSAFNHAYAAGLVADDKGWRGVKRFKGADASRVRVLKKDECTRLVNACPVDFRRLVVGGLMSGARYSELCRLQVQDFDVDTGKVFIAKSKNGKHRYVPLTKEGIAFFNSVTAGKAPDALIFTKDRDGGAWGKSHQVPMMKEAAARAKLKHIGFHGLRHSYATFLVKADVPYPVIAEALGHTSIEMVKRFYSHIDEDYVTTTIREKAISLGITSDNKVRKLRAS